MRTYTDDQLREAVKNARCYADIIKSLDLAKSGDTYRNIKERVSMLNIDTSHLKAFFNPNAFKKLPADDLFTANSKISATTIKKYLIARGIVENKCDKCGLTDWQGKPISLQLDHINGIRNDNRVENLHLLCPNCHSQTDTWGSRKEIKPPNTCKECGEKIRRNSIHCKKHAYLSKTTNTFIWPPISELLQMVAETGSCIAVAKKLGLADGTVWRYIHDYQEPFIPPSPDEKAEGKGE